MPFNQKLQKFNAKINTVTIGSGDKTVTIGGDSTYPFYSFDAPSENTPKIGVEISDMGLENVVSEGIKAYYDGASTIGEMAKKAADMEGAVDMGFAPFHDFHQLVPIFHLFKLHLFDGRACDNQTIPILLLYLVEGFIEGKQMILWCVFGFVASGMNQLQLNLQGGIAQETGKLCFGIDFCRHEV